jgi:hypothetical protein
MMGPVWKKCPMDEMKQEYDMKPAVPATFYLVLDAD